MLEVSYVRAHLENCSSLLPAEICSSPNILVNFWNRFEKEAASDFVSSDDQVILNVGGQKFQTTAGVLCRDRFSLLACICKTAPPIRKDEDGAFFFERDW